MSGLRQRLWAWPWELRRLGILGMNRRNAEYILWCNPRGQFPRVDDKLLTKQICGLHAVPVPETYAVVERQGDVRRLAETIGQYEQYVIKPARGSGGRGILVIDHHRGETCVTAGGHILTAADMRYHVSTVLAGLYSLSGLPDRVIVEQRIRRHPIFDQVAVGGTPDIRVVVYRSIPVMAMVRLPTRISSGRANLHQGAIGAGIDLPSGVSLGGVCRSRTVDVHPDTQCPIAGIAVPFWQTVLAAAVRLSRYLEMDYVGIDFVLDEVHGPLVIEANARPGLAIQLANRAGLLPRLQAVDGALKTITPQALKEECPTCQLQLLHSLVGGATAL